MTERSGKIEAVAWLMLCAVLTVLSVSLPLRAEAVSLQALVTPSTTLLKDGRPVTFALYGFIEFKSLAELFPYVESQTRRWNVPGGLDDTQRRRLAGELLRRGIESRVISMEDERPLEALLTHTSEELRQALARVNGPVPPGYGEAFLAVQEKWKHSLNCWSASPSISGRVLSNWYPIEEGIQLYGATYDSTEHFWQAVKYHPDATVADLTDLLGMLEQKDWGPWLARLDGDPKIYLPNAYAVEFLRHNLARERLQWFRDELGRRALSASDHARVVQQRGVVSFRFSSFEEKVLWGDLADMLHLVYTFSQPDDPIRKALGARHFDAVYLGERRMGFISEEFRSLMLEIWRVKYLKVARFREVISSIPMEIRLSHFLNDGDSPDIPIPVYVGYLNEIRELARAR
ncbi:MAG TPA: hypothetical protein VNX60_03250 [Candidatus Acidoferrum sp.]|nr:hypothetical protein [Candidatus Acidoferrum sp.]